MATDTIKAIHVRAYGEPDQLVLEQVARPQPGEQEVLIRVHSAGVNPVDWKIRQGWLKDFIPMQFPYIPGQDVAGVVEEVGPGVTDFQKGQEVYGETWHGSYAEYTLASTAALALKPKNLTLEEAASVPTGSATAWQALFDQGGLQAGQRVLIHGASGGVGLFAVQFAKWKGAHVIGTASTANVDFVRLLGADTVIDYRTTPFEQVVQDVDLVLDTIGGKTQERSWQVLKRGGTLVSVVAPPSQEKAKEHGVHARMFSKQSSSEILQTIAKLIEDGQVKTAIAKEFPLSEAAQAHVLSQSGHGRGRIILRIN